jgi:hypothetical protein
MIPLRPWRPGRLSCFFSWAGVVALAAACNRDSVGSPTGQPPTSAATSPTADAARGSHAGTCGVERWDVKTGTDTAARAIDLSTAIPAGVDALRLLPAPTLLDVHAPRTAEERIVKELRDVRLVCVKHEDDRDDHLVVEERGDAVVEPGEDRGCKRLHDAPSLRTLVVEVPDPVCLPDGHPWRDRIAAVRALVDRETHPEERARRVNRIVSLRGVTFFDVVHGQLGVAPNGVELHPVVSMCFGESCEL